MSYLPIPRCISISCENSPADLSYFIVLSMAKTDYDYFQDSNSVDSEFQCLSLENGVLHYVCTLAYVFNDPATNGGAYDLLLPCCPNNGPAANTFYIDYTNQDSTTSSAHCPILLSGGTINPPKKTPSRDLGDDVGTPYPFFIESELDPSNVSLGVAIDIPASINPRLNPGAPSSDPSVLSLVAEPLLNSTAYDIAIYNVQPLGSYTSVVVNFPDGSSSTASIGPGNQTFTI